MMWYFYALSLILVLLKGFGCININWFICFIPVLVCCVGQAIIRTVIGIIKSVAYDKIEKLNKEIDDESTGIFVRDSLIEKRNVYEKLLKIEIEEK